MSDWIDKLDRQVFPFVEYPGYDARYPALEGIPLTEVEAEGIRDVSRKLYTIFAKACDIARQGNQQFLQDMEIPPKLWPYLTIPNPLHEPTWLSRFDFVYDERQKLRMVELNADTPCGIIEAYYGNAVYCKEQFRINPNAGEQAHLEAFLKRVYDESFQPTANLETGSLVAAKPFVFSCFHDYIEDFGTTKYLMETMCSAVEKTSPIVPTDESIQFISFYDIQVDKETGDCILPDGRTAGGLYRLHPLEILVEEVAEDGYPIGTRLLDGYEDGRFLMMNPPEAILMQSKAFQALVWSLMEDGRFYTAEENAFIRETMLPTYFTEADCPLHTPYIVKPIWGREGLGIQVRQDGSALFQKEVPAPEKVVRRDSENMVYQKFVHQPARFVRTDAGAQKGYVTMSCFMLASDASALYARFSPEEVAGTEAYWLPLFQQ